MKTVCLVTAMCQGFRASALFYLIIIKSLFIPTFWATPWNLAPVSLFGVWKWKSLSRVRLFATPWTIHVHGILQATILEWVAIPFSRGSSQRRDWTQVSHIAGGFFTSWATRETWICCSLLDSKWQKRVSSLVLAFGVTGQQVQGTSGLRGSTGLHA